MVATRPTLSFLSSRKEGRPRLHRASGSWKCGPRVSADLVNPPQDFPLDFHGDGVLCVVRCFNVRTSLLWFRTVSVLSQGVHGAPPRAVPSCSCKAWKNFVTRQTTSSIGPSLTGHWTNDFMAANPANAPSGSFHLAFKAANHSIGGSVLFLIIIYLPVY